MGCSNSRQENFEKINLCERLKSETKSYDGSETVRERVLFPEKHEAKLLRLEECRNKAVTEDQIMNQKTSEQFLENPRIEHSVFGNLKAEGSLSEAIDLLDFSEISERESSSSIISLNDMKEDAQDVPLGFWPGIYDKSPRYEFYLDFAKTNGQHNPKPLAYCAKMNRALSHNNSSGRVLIGQKAEDIFKRRRTNHYDHISGYTWGQHMSSRNCWHVQNSSGTSREYQSIHDTINSACKSMETRILKYDKISKEPEKCVTSFNDTALEHSSGTETGSCELIETENVYKTNRPTMENSKYPENKMSASLSTDSSAYLQRKTLSTQKFIVAQLFLQTLQC